MLKTTAMYVALIIFLMSGFSYSLSINKDKQWVAPIKEMAKRNPVPYTVSSVERGKSIFHRDCKICHGYWGEGNGIVGLTFENKPANLLRLAGKRTGGEFAWKIAEGRGKMPSFRDALEENDIWDLVNFITSLENETGSAGESIVIQRCVVCHGLSGEAYYSQWSDLPKFSQQEIEEKLRAHRDGKVPDSMMSKVVFDLTDEEIRAAARYYSSLKTKAP